MRLFSPEEIKVQGRESKPTDEQSFAGFNRMDNIIIIQIQKSCEWLRYCQNEVYVNSSTQNDEKRVKGFFKRAQRTPAYGTDRIAWLWATIMRCIEHGTTMSDPMQRAMPFTNLQGTVVLRSQPRQTPRGFPIEETAETARSTLEFPVV
ncbi:hypothetical protein TNCV_4612701 [Trichonephila clavipes]|nr:hypothetical protein TNCV_4612701 [Trichonephila clavipes]